MVSCGERRIEKRSARPPLLQTVLTAKVVSRIGPQVPAVRWGCGPGENQSASLGSDAPGERSPGLRHAAAAADVSGTRQFTAGVFPARCAAKDLQKLQRIEARGDVAERFDDALWLLP